MCKPENIDKLFNIYEAHYVYAVDCHSGQWSRSYAIFGKLDQKGFKAGLGLKENGYDALSDEGKEMYGRLVKIGY